MPVEVIDGQDAKRYFIGFRRSLRDAIRLLSRAPGRKCRHSQQKRDPNETCYCSHYFPTFNDLDLTPVFLRSGEGQSISHARPG